MRRYAETGEHPGPLPTPGVFARHNAVDTPALLPDGTVSELSVSATLRARGDRSWTAARIWSSRSTQTDAGRRAPSDDLLDEDRGGDR